MILTSKRSQIGDAIDLCRPPEILKEQITVAVDGMVITVNHIFNGTKSIREIYADFIERKLCNP